MKRFTPAHTRQSEIEWLKSGLIIPGFKNGRNSTVANRLPWIGPHAGKDVGSIRVMFPKAPHSEHEHLVEISRKEFFDEFERRQSALWFDPDEMFSKIVGRDTAEKRAHGDHGAAR
jgi:hypothetical protein